jgi:shikimate dehydrogenase
MSDNTLKSIREAIDKIDDQVITLLEKRLFLAKKTTSLKPQITDKVREKQILAKITSPNIKKIYKAILKVSQSVQK